MINVTKKHYTFLSIVALVVLVAPHIAAASDWSGSPIQELLYTLVVNLFGMLVRIGGALLDYSIDNFVLGFGDTFAHSGIGVAVNNGWVVIRDSINLFFIFGLVYIGIKMILDSDSSNNRRWLANLILAALLINFSLFATKMVVDFSNQISAEIAVAGLGALAPGDPGNDTGKYKSTMSANMMGQLGLPNAFNTHSKPEGAGYGYIFGLAILFMITAFVFGAGGILLIIRFAVLNLFLVFSAAMFLSWVLPGLSDTMDKYWKAFLKRAFFAPIFFLFLYFAFQMVGELQKTIKGGLATSQSLAGGLGGEAGADPKTIYDATLGTIPFFFLVCIFMIIALVAAQKIGADGASKAVSIGKSWGSKVRSGVQKGAGSATFGTAARLGQGTAGALANTASNNRRFQNFAANNKLGRAALGATRKVADSSFDARRVGGLGKSMGIGEGQKGGFVTRIKDREKRDEEFMKSLADADMKDPKHQARAAALAAEKTVESKKKIEEAHKNTKQANKEKATVAAMQATQNKTYEELDTEIADLGKDINELTAQLSQKVAAKTITTDERAAIEKTIIEKTKARDLNISSQSERDKEIVLEAQIQKAGLDASLAVGMPVTQAKFREQQQQLQKELDDHRNFAKREALANEEIIKAKQDIAAADNEIAQASVDANNEVRFESKQTFLNNISKKSERSFTPLEKASLANLKKKFGANVAEMATKDKESKEQKKLAEQLAQIQKDGAGPEKKEEPKSE
jgi:hypothetical protein